MAGALLHVSRTRDQEPGGLVFTYPLPLGNSPALCYFDGLNVHNITGQKFVRRRPQLNIHAGIVRH